MAIISSRNLTISLLSYFHTITVPDLNLSIDMTRFLNINVVKFWQARVETPVFTQIWRNFWIVIFSETFFLIFIGFLFTEDDDFLTMFIVYRTKLDYEDVTPVTGLMTYTVYANNTDPPYTETSGTVNPKIYGGTMNDVCLIHNS